MQRRIAAILDKADEVERETARIQEMRDEIIQATFLDMFGDPGTNSKNLLTSPVTEVFGITTGKLDSNASVPGGNYPFFTCSKDVLSIDRYAFDCECLLLAGNNASGDFDVKYYDGKFDAYQRTYVLTSNGINLQYGKIALEYQLEQLKRVSLGTNTKYLTLKILERIFLQLPPIELQNQFADIVHQINAMDLSALETQATTLKAALSQKLLS